MLKFYQCVRCGWGVELPDLRRHYGKNYCAECYKLVKDEDSIPVTNGGIDTVNISYLFHMVFPVYGVDSVGVMQPKGGVKQC